MENFGILTPGDPNFDLSQKMTEMISKWFSASFRTLPFVFLYGDQEPRSWGGAFKRPPPPPSRRWKIQRPSRARVKDAGNAGKNVRKSTKRLVQKNIQCRSWICISCWWHLVQFWSWPIPKQSNIAAKQTCGQFWSRQFCLSTTHGPPERLLSVSGSHRKSVSTTDRQWSHLRQASLQRPPQSHPLPLTRSQANAPLLAKFRLLRPSFLRLA